MSAVRKLRLFKTSLTSPRCSPGGFRTGKDAKRVVGRVYQSFTDVHVPSLRVPTVSACIFAPTSARFSTRIEDAPLEDCVASKVVVL